MYILTLMKGNKVIKIGKVCSNFLLFSKTWNHIFTPRQVKAIVDYLGEP